MPGEFNDLIPLPNRTPRRPIGPEIFDADDLSFVDPEAEPATGDRLLGPAAPEQFPGESVEDDDPFGPPRPTPVFGAPEVIPETDAQSVGPMGIDRVFNRFARAANRAITEGGPIGLDPERVQAFRDFGVFNRDPSDPSLLGTANEVLIGGGLALADLGLRALAAPVEGGIAGFGQTLQELGVSRGGARSAERDLRGLLTVAPFAAANFPGAVAALPTAVRMRRTRRQFRPLPFSKEMRFTSTEQDFKETIANVLKTGRSSVGEVARTETGPITIDFGRVDRIRKFKRRPPKRRRGFGLQKIIRKRTLVDGIDGERFVRERVPEILARGKIRFNGEDKEKERRAALVLGEDIIVLSLWRFDDREAWVLTSYKKKKMKRKK